MTRNPESGAQDLSAIKLAMLAQQLRSQAKELDLLRAEPIAIIGLGCRFPGGANSPEAYWQLLKDGRDAITEVPVDRWDVDALYDPNPGTPGKMTSRWGGFLDSIDQFDPGFFGLSPREASRMDPQQRLVLEVAFEALERAGLTREQLNGSQTGVYIASTAFDYGQLQLSDRLSISAHTVTGMVHCILSNRLSYLLNLQGPSLSLDTACSSSLVGIHLACQSLKDRETNLAIAGGVNIVLSPDIALSLAKWGMLAADGRCKTFDAHADGFVRAEGCGIVVLKRLADAVADGDPVLAVLRGSAVNQDGRSTQMTAPNGLAQQAVIRSALQRSGVTPDQVTYIETHGTGTVLGDPIEVEALAEIYGSPRADGQPLVLGAAKTNIGHCEAAAGVAGLIKVVLSLQHHEIPRNLHFSELNPHIHIDGTRLAFPVETWPWPAGQSRRVAGVSSFGFGGTNAHLLIEEAPALPRPEPPDAAPQLVLVSGHSDEALRDQAAALERYLTETAAVDLADVAYTSALHRNHLDHRLAVVGETPTAVAKRLRDFVDRGARQGWATGVRQPGRPPRLAFVFSGQGPQWWAMGRELLETSDIFREVIERCDALLTPLAGWSLLKELNASESESRLDQTEVAQPALFALQAGLAAQWQAWGVNPTAVVGHSVGEIAAAYVAGVLTLEDAIHVAYHRGRLMQAATGHGQMASVELSEADAQQLLTDSGVGDRLSVAAINTPTSVVLSGESVALAGLLSGLQTRGVGTRLLPVQYAFHSPQMDPYAAELTRVLAGLAPRPATLKLVSTVSGDWAVPNRDYNAAYWGLNVRQTVRFSQSIEMLMDAGFSAFIEVGPHPVLSGYVQQHLQTHGVTGFVTHSLRRGQPERATLLVNLGAWHTHGGPVSWSDVFPEPGTVLALPAYAWQHERHWFEPTAPAAQTTVTATRGRTVAGTGHPLLGTPLRSPALQGRAFEADWGPGSVAFFDDHHVYGDCIAPATAMIELMAAGARRQFSPDATIQIEGFAIHVPMIFADDADRAVQLLLRSADGAALAAEVVSAPPDVDDEWTRHATAVVRIGSIPAPAGSLADARARCDQSLSVENYYRHLDNLGISFGETFRGLRQVWRSDSAEAVSHIQVAESLRLDLDRYELHPALLDACFQTLAAVFLGDGQRDLHLPFGFDRLHLYGSVDSDLWCWARQRSTAESAPEIRTGDLLIFDAEERLVAWLEGLHLKRASSEQLHRTGRPAAIDTRVIAWEPASVSGAANMAGSWLVLADRSGVGEALAARLADGGRTVVVTAGDTYSRLADDHWQLNALAAEDFQRLFAEPDLAGVAWRGVVGLWALDASGQFDPDHPQHAAAAATAGLLHVTQRIVQGSTLPRMWLVTRGAQVVDPAFDLQPAIAQAPVLGLAATIALEHPELVITRVDLDPLSVGDTATLLFEALSIGPDEDRLAIRNGKRLAARLAAPTTRAEFPDDEPWQLVAASSGVLDEVRVSPATRRTPSLREVEIRVMAAGLNYRDVLNALGMYPGDAGPLGGECAGIITAVGPEVAGWEVGDEVMAVAAGAFRSHVVTRAEFVVRKPAGLTFEAAAGLPSVYLTAMYGLNELARLQPDERVLIHSAAGGVGMAAMQVARRAGAIVYGTAGNPVKRALVVAQGAKAAMDSRTLAFREELESLTNGAGVHVVLNALSGDFITASAASLVRGGRFLEIGKRDIWSSERFAEARPDVTYFPFDLSVVMADDPALIQRLLCELAQAIESGSLAALPVQTFSFAQAADAFRHMAQARHVGKIVLVADTTPSAPTIRADGAYLISGGLGGLGLATAGWLIERGARHVILASRREPSPEARQHIAEWERQGARVEALSLDVSQRAEVERLFAGWGDRPSLRGVIHAAGTLDDGAVTQLTWKRFEPVLAAKMDGAWNLHEATRGQPLDFFVMYSSASSVLGAYGQGNYAAANAFLDSFAQWRHAQGLPALSVDWGAWADTGMAARLGDRDRARLAEQGYGLMASGPALSTLGGLLASKLPQALALIADWGRLAQRSVQVSSFFEHVRQAERRTAQPTSGRAPSLRSTLLAAPATRRRALLLGHVREQAVRVLGLPRDQVINPQQPLNELGLDSLMAVELRNALGASLERSLSTTLLFDYPTLDALVDHLLGDLAPAETPPQDPTPPQASAPTTPSPGAADIAALSEDEAEALLLAELAQLKREGRKHG